MSEENVLLDQSVQFAKETLIEKGEIHSMFTVHTLDGKIYCFLTPISSDEEKAFLLNLLKHVFLLIGVKEYLYMSEGWALVQKKEKLDLSIRPSESKDRIEVLHVCCVSREKKEAKMFEIKRSNTHHQIKELTEIQFPGQGPVKVSGAFTSLLEFDGKFDFSITREVVKDFMKKFSKEI